MSNREIDVLLEFRFVFFFKLFFCFSGSLIKNYSSYFYVYENYVYIYILLQFLVEKIFKIIYLQIL